MRKLLARLVQRPRVKVGITCPHGEFIPGAFTPGGAPSRYGCERCGFRVTLSTLHGGINW